VAWLTGWECVGGLELAYAAPHMRHTPHPQTLIKAMIDFMRGI
jgi:hypothetical protein